MHHPYLVLLLPILPIVNGFVTISQYPDQINENVVADESPINVYGASVQIRSYAIIP